MFPELVEGIMANYDTVSEWGAREKTMKENFRDFDEARIY
jgi:hypothetical protein